MKLRGILALALALAYSPALAQVTPGTSPLQIPDGGTGGATAAAARTSLGLAIGADVQAWNALLDCFSGLGTTGILRRTGAGTCSAGTAVALGSEVSGTLAATNGGTGQNTFAIGDLLQASSSSALARLAAVATGNVLLSGGVGVVSAWGKVGLTTHVTGTLPIGNGGTGDTGTAWATFTPSPACGSATITTTSARSKTLGKTMWMEIDFTITVIGTCTQTLSFTLPSVTAQSGGGIVGREFGVSGKGFVCDVRAASASATCSLSDFTSLQVNAHMVASGVFEIQ